MKERESARYTLWALAYLLAWTIFRAIYSCGFQLSPDETNYWQWGRHLAWGYHDQAPMIGWLIRLCTEIFGTSAFSVRLPSIAASAVSCAYIILFARRWMGARAAWAVAILSQGILEFNAGGLLATADAIQAAGWAGAAYHTARAFEDGSWRQWLLAGLWFGFGMLSKFTMVLFGPCALCFGLFSPRHRGRLASIRPWASLALGSLMFFPVIVWNARHGWNSARHVASIGGANETFFALHWKFFGDYIGSQAALLTPLVFILIVWAWVLAWKKRGNWTVWYCFWTSLPVFAGFALLSLHSRIYGNWPGAGYPTAVVLVAAFFGPGCFALGMRFKPVLWTATLIVAYLMTTLLIIQTVWPVLPIPVKLDRPATELSGWSRLGAVAGETLYAMPRPNDTFLFGTRYQIASELAYYAPGRPQTVSINRWTRPNVYDYWVTDAELKGKDGVGVTMNASDGRLLATVFTRVDSPMALPIFRTRPFSNTPELVKTFYIFRCYGFLGGLAWIPPASDDIRKGST